MLAIKNNIINNLNTINLEAVNDAKQWLSIKNIKNDEELTKQYSTIYQENNYKNKWILMINPENSALVNIEKTPKKTFSKILRVNANKGIVKVKNIEAALRKGNCSAVILNDVKFNEQELTQLYLGAKKGNTACIIINNQK